MLEGQVSAYNGIEVTHDMVVAGDAVLRGYVEGYCTPEEILTQLYRVMTLARDMGHGDAVMVARQYER